jgi:hypothetical protein
MSSWFQLPAIGADNIAFRGHAVIIPRRSAYSVDHAPKIGKFDCMLSIRQCRPTECDECAGSGLLVPSEINLIQPHHSSGWQIRNRSKITKIKRISKTSILHRGRANFKPTSLNKHRRPLQSEVASHVVRKWRLIRDRVAMFAPDAKQEKCCEQNKTHSRLTPVVRRGGGETSSMPQTRRPADASTTLVRHSTIHVTLQMGG